MENEKRGDIYYTNYKVKNSSRVLGESTCLGPSLSAFESTLIVLLTGRDSLPFICHSNKITPQRFVQPNALSY